MKEEKQQLCPKCQTGLDSLRLDKHTPVCPYLNFHDGTNCAKFMKLKEELIKSSQKILCRR